MEGEFRIDYTILYQGPDDEDFREIGFGTSGEAATVDAASYAIESDIQNRQWETSVGMPAPGAVDEDEDEDEEAVASTGGGEQ